MKAYVVQSGKRIEPFGDHPQDCLIANVTLRQHQEAALRAVGIDMVPVPDATPITDANEHLVFTDQVYCTPELLKEFLTQSRKQKASTVLCLKPGITTLRTVVATQDVSMYPDRVEYNVRYVSSGGKVDDCQPIVIEPDVISDFVPMSTHMTGSREYRVPLTPLLIVQIDHWANLWSANIATLLTGISRLLTGPKIRLLALAVRARSFNRWKVLRQTNRTGSNCDIHPTAYIEGSTIGDNVKIGAGAIVRECVVGSNTYIANAAAAELSVIGEGCVLQGGAVVQYCVLYPGAFTFSKGLNASMCGRDTFVGDGACLTDFRFDGAPVTVMKCGTRVSTGNTFLGACLGHNVYLGSGCVIAPGRAIPNGLHIAVAKERLIASFPASGEVPGFQIINITSKALP